MKLLFAAASAAALFLAGPALAQSALAQFYGNLGYAHHTVDPGNGGEDVSLGTIDARLGARFGQYFGAEGEAGLGVKNETVGTGADEIDVKLENKIGAYAVGFLPVAPNADLFARVGYSRLEVGVEGFGAAASESEGALSYGAGAQYMFDGVNGVRADYTRYDFDEGGDMDSFGLAYVRRF